jgi:hypothetical protein
MQVDDLFKLDSHSVFDLIIIIIVFGGATLRGDVNKLTISRK